MENHDHLTPEFLLEVSGMLVLSMGDKFQEAVEAETQLQVRSSEIEGILMIVSFTQVQEGGRLIEFHTPSETIALEFNYVPNAEVKVVRYHKAVDTKAIGADTLLSVLGSALEKLHE